MSTQKKASAKKKAPKPGAGKRPKRPTYPTEQEALNDLVRFIRSQEHLPDVWLNEERLMSEVRMVSDNRLIASLKELLQAAIFRDKMGVSEEDLMLYSVTQEFVNLLEELRMARISDGARIALRAQQN